MKLADAPELLTAREAAALLRIGRNQLYNAVSEGRVPSIRIGKTIRVPRRSIEHLLEGGQPG